jgi:hypothetical protein
MKLNKGQLILLIGSIFLVSNGICFYIVGKEANLSASTHLMFTGVSYSSLVIMVIGIYDILFNRK